MHTNFTDVDPRDNFLALESEINFASDDAIPEEETDDDEIWEIYEEEDL